VRQKIRKFSRRSEKSAALAKDLKNPRRYIKVVNDSLQVFYSSAWPGLPIGTSAFDMKNYILKWAAKSYEERKTTVQKI